MKTDKTKIVELDFRDMLPIGVTVAVTGIAMAYALDIQEDVQSDMVTNTAGCNATVTTSCGSAYNATGDGITATAKVSSRLITVVGVLMGALIIGVLIRNFQA